MNEGLATPPPIIKKYHDRYCELTGIPWELHDPHINLWWQALCYFGVINSRSIDPIGDKDDLAAYIKDRLKMSRSMGAKGQNMLRPVNMFDYGKMRDFMSIRQCTEMKRQRAPIATQVASCLKPQIKEIPETEKKALQIKHGEYFEKLRKELFG